MSASTSTSTSPSSSINPSSKPSTPPSSRQPCPTCTASSTVCPPSCALAMLDAYSSSTESLAVPALVHDASDDDDYGYYNSEDEYDEEKDAETETMGKGAGVGIAKAKDRKETKTKIDGKENGRGRWWKREGRRGRTKAR